MKKAIFWINLLLNAIALVIAGLWAAQQKGYESWVTLVALAASTISLFSTKEHWLGAAGHTVTQVGNVAGGDLAGGNITKNSTK